MYYDGCKLLSQKDLDGNTPEIFLCVGNRTSGKTTYFNRLLINRFIKNKSQFMLVYRWANELYNVAPKFFTDISQLFFPADAVSSKNVNNSYVELYFNKELCGYAVALNTASKLKNYSHFFSNVQHMLFDEFTPEDGKYTPDEVTKLISLHMSVARGQGKQTRYVPLYMLSNAVTLLNPYYTEFNIGARLKADTKFLRGHGWVMESAYVDSAARAISESGFSKAFSNNKYIAYAKQNIYLNDNLSLVERLSGPSNYIATIKSEGETYGIREMRETGLMYVSKSVDLSHHSKIAVCADDITPEFRVYLNHPTIRVLRYYFNNGCFRFQSLEAKEATFKLLSIR